MTISRRGRARIPHRLPEHVVVVLLVDDEHRKWSKLLPRGLTRLMIRLVGLGVALLLAACGSNAAPAASTPAVNPGMAQRTLDPESPYQTTPEEYGLQLKACLTDGGFNVELDPYDFSLKFNLGSDRPLEELQAAMTECRTGLDPSRNEPPPPLSEGQLRELYRYHVAQANCLIAAGYPASSAPPEQVFVDAGGQWDPRMGPEEPLDIPQAVDRSCEQIDDRPNFLDW